MKICHKPFQKEYTEIRERISTVLMTDVLCGKNLGCKTILVDSITADIEKPIVRFARKLERCFIKH